MRSPNHYHYTRGSSFIIVFLGLATPRPFYCSFALFSSPGRTGGLFPRLKAPKKTGRIKKDAAGRSYDFRLDTVALRPCLSTSLPNKYILSLYHLIPKCQHINATNLSNARRTAPKF